MLTSHGCALLQGGEQGVSAVTYLEGTAVFEARDRGLWCPVLMEEAGSYVNRTADKSFEDYEGVALLLVCLFREYPLGHLTCPLQDSVRAVSSQ